MDSKFRLVADCGLPLTIGHSLSHHKNVIPRSPVHSSASTPGEFAISTHPATSAGVNASGGSANLGASFESSPSVSGEVEADDSPSPELGGRATRELRWLGGTPVFPQERIRGEQRQLDLGSAALLVE